SIKDMMAKPIIDIVIGVSDITNIDRNVFRGLKEAGFLRLKVERPNEIVFAKFTDDRYKETNHINHLVDYNKYLLKNFIIVIHYFNANEIVQNQYEKLKLEFHSQKSGGIESYTDYKEQFVKDIYAKRV